jgi:hypothetical protein
VNGESFAAAVTAVVARLDVVCCGDTSLEEEKFYFIYNYL